MGSTVHGITKIQTRLSDQHTKLLSKIDDFLNLYFRKFHFLNETISVKSLVSCRPLINVGFVLAITVYSWSNSSVSEQPTGF